MRVLHFRYVFSLLSETFIYDYVIEQQRQGLDVHVATTARFEQMHRPFEPLHVLGLPPRLSPERVLRRIWYSGRSGQNEQRHLWYHFRRRLSDVIQTVRPDVIHAHFGPDGVIAVPLARRFGIPLVVQFYGYDVSLPESSTEWRAEYGKLFEKAERLIVLSEEMGRALVASGAPHEKLREVHLAKRMADYPFKIRSGPLRRWLSIGRLTDKKGHQDAIEAIRRLRERGVDATLDVIGDGERRRHLEAFVRERNLQDVVRLLGPIPHAQVVRALDEADAFVLMSCTGRHGDREGTPTVLLEAQAMGLTVVSTRHAGIPEMLPELARPYLVAERDAGACCDAMLALSNLDATARSKLVHAGRDWVLARYELSRQVQEHAAIYAEVTPPYRRTS